MAEDAHLDFFVAGESHTLKYRDSDHSYRLDGKRIASCSTLAKVCYSDPSGLMGYARKEALAGRDHRETTKTTQEAGTAAHDQLEALARTGKPLDLSGQPERVRGALQGVAKWWLDHKPIFVASEVIICSMKYRYAGRFDFLAWVGGELVLGDLKTSDKDWSHFAKFKGSAAYAQLAGYAVAYQELFPNEVQPESRAILHVNTNGDYDWKPDLAPEQSEAAFLSKVQTYRADQQWSKAYAAVAKVAA